MFLSKYLSAYDWRKHLTPQILREQKTEYVFPPRERGSRRSQSEQVCFHDRLEGKHEGHKDAGDWVLYVNGQFKSFGPLEILVTKTPYPELFGKDYNVYLRKIVRSAVSADTTEKVSSEA